MEDPGALRSEGHQQFTHFIDLAKRTSQKDFHNPADRVAFIKQTEPDDFFRFLHDANRTLRGEKLTKWTGEATRTVVQGLGAIDLDPPDHAEVEFKRFYEEMREKITPENSVLWSAKLYTAIILGHMFPDGNGRLGRNVYALMRTGDVLTEEQSSNRGKNIADYSGAMSREAILRVIHKDDITQENDLFVIEQEYAGNDVGDDPQLPGFNKLLKYTAARRVLQRHRQFNPQQKEIAIGELSPQLQEEYRREYQEVRKEAFWEGVNAVDSYQEWCLPTLDAAIGLVA